MRFGKWLDTMSTLLENIKHLPLESQRMVLNEAPQGWLVGSVPEPIRNRLGNARQYFLDLGFEDWPNANEVGNTYLTAVASTGVGIPGTKFILRSPRTHELTIELGEGTLTMRDDWLCYLQLLDFHRTGDPVVWFGLHVRADRRAGDFATNPERFKQDSFGWQRIAD